MKQRLRAFVEKRLAETGVNPFEAARTAGLERGFINDILQGKKNTIRGSNISKLAKALDVPIVNLIEETSESNLMPEMKDWISKNLETLEDEPIENIESLRIKHPKARLRSAVAIYNLIKTFNGETLIEPRPNNFIQEEEFTRRLRIDYAVIVYDEYMEPEFSPGDMALIDSKHPPVKNSSLLFRTEGKNDFGVQVCFGRLLDSDKENWLIKQWAFEKVIVLAKHDWPSCHKIVGKIVR